MKIMRQAALLGVTAALLAAAVPALADAPVVIPVDQLTRLNVPGSAASVVVGNPNVADVTVVDSHTVFLQGKTLGQTDVVVLGEDGATLFQGSFLVAGPTANRVTVYRGAKARADMSCAPGCSPVQGAGNYAGGSPATTSVNTSGSPLGAAANLGAVGAALN